MPRFPKPLTVVSTGIRIRWLGTELASFIQLGASQGGQRNDWYTMGASFTWANSGKATATTNCNPRIRSGCWTTSSGPEHSSCTDSFRLTDDASGRILEGTLEIHTLELPKYNATLHLPRRRSGLVAILAAACAGYEPAALRAAFQQPAIRRASEALIRISEISEDKAMYDARERAIRDRKWELEEAIREARQEARQEGRQEGRSEGIIEGELQGQTRGHVPGQDRNGPDASGAAEFSGQR